MENRQEEQEERRLCMSCANLNHKGIFWWESMREDGKREEMRLHSIVQKHLCCICIELWIEHQVHMQFTTESLLPFFFSLVRSCMINKHLIDQHTHKTLSTGDPDVLSKCTKVWETQGSPTSKQHTVFITNSRRTKHRRTVVTQSLRCMCAFKPHINMTQTYTSCSES